MPKGVAIAFAAVGMSTAFLIAFALIDHAAASDGHRRHCQENRSGLYEMP